MVMVVVPGEGTVMEMSRSALSIKIFLQYLIYLYKNIKLPLVLIFPKDRPKLTLTVKAITKREMIAMIQYFLLLLPPLVSPSMQAI